MSETKTIEQVLADFAEDAAVLERTGHPNLAKNITRVIDGVRSALPDYLAWLSESEAQLRANKGVDYFRTRFAEWEERGLAKLVGRRRFYRGVVVPQRMLPSLVRAAAERGRAEGMK